MAFAHARIEVTRDKLPAALRKLPPNFTREPAARLVFEDEQAPSTDHQFATLHLANVRAQVAAILMRQADESFDIRRAPDGTPWLRQYPNQSDADYLHIAGALRDLKDRGQIQPKRFVRQPAGHDTGKLRTDLAWSTEGNFVVISLRSDYATNFQEGGEYRIGLEGVKRAAGKEVKRLRATQDNERADRRLRATQDNERADKLARAAGIGNAKKTHYTGWQTPRPVLKWTPAQIDNAIQLAGRRVFVAHAERMKDAGFPGYENQARLFRPFVGIMQGEHPNPQSGWFKGSDEQIDIPGAGLGRT